jgi:hypothetical protein
LRALQVFVVGLWVVMMVAGGVREGSAQGGSATATVSGRVTEITGGAVPGVTVTLTNKVMGTVVQAKTGADGSYSIGNVPVGHAKMMFSYPGFSAYTVNDVMLMAGQSLTQSAVLRLGESVRAVMATSTATGDEAGGGTRDYVRVSVDAVAGPLGYASQPSMTAATQTQNAQQQALAAAQKFNFPSVIFYISASPLVYLPSGGSPDGIQAAQETDRNPLWLDATFTLIPEDKDGNAIPMACTDGSVQVLGLLPQANISAAKDSVAADVASGVVDVSGALASFYPNVATGVASATKAMNILFQDLFPPKPVAYQYPSMNGNCEVGWFFRPNTSATAGAQGQASILGIQTGIVLLKTTKDIVQIRLSGQTLSAWSKPPTSYSKKLYVGQSKDIGVVKLPDADNIDYDNLTTLAMFPSLVPKGQAMKILHIDAPADYVTFAKANGLVGTNATFNYVTNASLAAFLQKGAVAAPVSAPAPPAGDGGKTPVVTAPVKPVPKPAPKVLGKTGTKS